MDQVDAVRRALREVGDVSHQEVAEIIKEKYGVVIRPQVVPILKATIKDEEMLAEWHRKSQVPAQTNAPSRTDGSP
jgi:hypothetical protein